MESFSDVWQLVLEHIQNEYLESNRLSRVAYKLWIIALKPDKLDGTVAKMKVDSIFKKKVILEQYTKLITDAFYEVLGFDVTLEIESEDGLEETPSDIEKRPEPRLIAGETNDDFLENGGYKYSFGSFIVGPSNKFAHAACVSVATNPWRTYNPLFLYGDSGLGKTHLLYAIFNELKRRRPDTKIVYTTAEQFGNELIEALQKNKQDHSFTDHITPFKEKYRSADVLLMDDIQFIIGKPQTEEEFFHTFEYLYRSDKQIVITSDRPTREMLSLTERVRNRFEMGLLADIQPPDFETRVAIIKRKAEDLRLELEDPIPSYIAAKVDTNIRQLEGVVKKMHAHKIFEGQEPNMVSAQNAIRDILTTDRPISVTVEKIISEVAKIYNTTPDDIKSKKRTANISEARHIAMYVLSETTQLTQDSIGAEFGGRDHTTVIYSISQVNKMMNESLQKKHLVYDLIKNVRGEK